ncbi:organic cation transporter protein-like isoform X1 [Maniola hyperantus]|uniref:organic cation transporter protein-like isoform X1 n=1 Tax=Aphantopus hyperantus TaxID=2795564 RepID=UPI001568C4B8|nr:organic cation transporter protein-like [Maniola hyperantus]
MSATEVVSDKNVDLDEILDKYGIFKRYHAEKIVLAFLAFATNTMYSTNYIFSAKEVPYRCKTDTEEVSYCSALNSTHYCSEWVYDEPNSFVAYFELACYDWKRTLVGSVNNFGYMCGLLLVGPMSDRLGRKTAIVITGVSGAVLGTLKSFSTWYWFYIAIEFLEAAIGDICSPMYVWTLEIVSTKNKLVYYMICSFGFTFGGITTAFIAWLTPNWRWFLRTIYPPALLFFFYKYLLDESPRWLLTKGRKDEAVKILQNAAKKNKITIDKNSLDNLTCEVRENVKFSVLLKDTFKSKSLRKRFVVCLIWWTTSTFVNYGLMINSVSLQGNKYVNFALTILVDLPGTIVTTYIMIHFKRKAPLMLSFFAGAVLCMSQPFLPSNLPWVSLTVYMAGKLMCSFYFAITYLYTLELFPTSTRNSMHALCSSLGRIGSIVAPQTPLLTVYWPGLPSFVFGLAALVAGLSTFLVPDIADDALPDTVLQAEALGKPRVRSKAVGAYNEGFDTQM